MRDRISYKLIIPVGGVATVMIGIFSYLIVESYQRQMIDDLEGYADQLSETVISSTRFDMLLNRRQSLHQIIKAIGSQDDIEKVRIFNKEGIIIVSTDSLDVGQMVDRQAEACYACHAVDQPLERLPIENRIRIFESDRGYRVSGIISPIYNEPSCWESACHAHAPDQQVLGVLDITTSLEQVDIELRQNVMRLLILSAIVIAAISVMIYLFVGRMILRPIGELARATRHIADGELTYTVENNTHDEIGQLATSFNRMTQKLADTQLQLFQSDKLASAGRLAAGVAHEINNPLTGVLTYSSFLLNRMQDDPEAKEDLEVIVRETKRCREIVKGLLDFSRQSKPRKRRVQIRDIITQAAKVVQNQLAIQKVMIVVNFQDGLPPVYVDENQLQQVFVNLFENAAFAMNDKGGTITIETTWAPSVIEKDTSCVMTSISDTGCGISPEHMDKIFEPFFSTKGQEGNGLGLAIVWGIIEANIGRVAVESEVGTGTTFSILLPVAQADQ